MRILIENDDITADAQAASSFRFAWAVNSFPAYTLWRNRGIHVQGEAGLCLSPRPSGAGTMPPSGERSVILL
jgi:hypothetical protein